MESVTDKRMTQLMNTLYSGDFDFTKKYYFLDYLETFVDRKMIDTLEVLCKPYQSIDLTDFVRIFLEVSPYVNKVILQVLAFVEFYFFTMEHLQIKAIRFKDLVNIITMVRV